MLKSGLDLATTVRSNFCSRPIPDIVFPNIINMLPSMPGLSGAEKLAFERLSLL